MIAHAFGARVAPILALLFGVIVMAAATSTSALVPTCDCNSEYRYVGGGWEARCNGNCFPGETCKGEDVSHLPLCEGFTTCTQCSCCDDDDNCLACEDNVCHSIIKTISSIIQPPDCSNVFCDISGECDEPDQDSNWESCCCPVV